MISFVLLTPKLFGQNGLFEFDAGAFFLDQRMAVLRFEAERVQQPEQMQAELVRLFAPAQEVGAYGIADVRIVDVERDQLWQKEVDLVFVELKHSVAQIGDHAGLFRFVQVDDSQRRVEQFGFEQSKQPGAVRSGLDFVQFNGYVFDLNHFAFLGANLVVLRTGRRPDGFLIAVLIVDGDDRIRFDHRIRRGAH